MTEMTAAPNVMADVKDWLLNKCRDASSALTVNRLPLHGGHQMTYSNVVVTPNNIPKFIIPSSMDPALRGLITPSRLDADHQSQSSSGGSVTSASGLCMSSVSRQHVQCQQQCPRQHLKSTSSIQCQSTLVSPIRNRPMETSHGNLVKSTCHYHDIYSESCQLGHTNSDPMSLAALSLRQPKMQTMYGFETLTKTPNTRRKESLFHNASPADVAFQGLPADERTSKRKLPLSLETLTPQIMTEDVEKGNSDGRNHKRRNNVPAMIAPLGIILSPNLQVSSSQSISYMGQRVSNNNRDPRSTQISRSLSTNHLYNSIDTKTKNLLQRRHSGSHLWSRLRTNQENWNLLKGPSTVSSSDISSPNTSCHSVSRSSDGGSGNDQHIQLGQVRLSLLYLPKQQQLRVGLIQAENLTSSNTRQVGQLNPYIKLCLMPKKVQRSVSRVIHNTQNPIFNQDFVFTDLHEHEMAEMSLRLKVYHKTAKLGRNELLGELHVSMAELIPSQEMRLLRELELVTSRHVLGHVEISVCFNPSTERLTVVIHQVANLNRHTLTGTPDPYVRVGLSQPRRSTTYHQTKTKKKNQAPVFNERFTFNISPKIEDLQYTSLTVTVLDHRKLWTDRQMGQVRLGFGATEEAEFNYWNQVLQQPDRLATGWHLLMDPVS